VPLLEFITPVRK